MLSQNSILGPCLFLLSKFLLATFFIPSISTVLIVPLSIAPEVEQKILRFYTSSLNISHVKIELITLSPQSAATPH